MKEETAAGEMLAKRTLTVMIVAIEMIAVTAMIVATYAVMSDAVMIESAGMTVNSEAHPEIKMMVSRVI